MSEIIEVYNLFELGVKGYNRMNGSVISPNGISQGIRANSGGHNEVKIIEPTIAAIRGRNPTSRESGEQLRQTLEIKRDDEKKSSIQGTHVTYPDGNVHAMTVAHVPKVAIINATTAGYIEAEPNDSVDTKYPESKTRRGRVQKGIGHTLQCDDGIATVTNELRIRKLTPLECLNLMSFDKDDFVKMKEAGLSDSRIYKAAGNSIVVDVLCEIFKQMLPNMEDG